MLSIQEPELRWGIAGWQTKLTGRLFTEEFFTFRKEADAFIEKTKALFADEGTPMNADDMFPVLLKVSTAICSDDEMSAYDAEQAAWLEQHGQAAKRRREQQVKDRGGNAP